MVDAWVNKVQYMLIRIKGLGRQTKAKQDQVIAEWLAIAMSEHNDWQKRIHEGVSQVKIKVPANIAKQFDLKPANTA